MSADALITREGPVAVPMDYNIPASSEIIPLTISATFDDPSSAGPYVPAIEIETPAGIVLGPYPLATTIAAGGSARVSWFPDVGVASASAAGLALIGARIYRSGTQSIPDSTNTDITFDTVDVDTAGMANLGANNRILTAQVAGFYLISGQLDYLHNTYGLRNLHLYLNGYYSSLTGTGIGTDQVPVTADVPQPLGPQALVYMNVGDFVSMGTRQTSGSSVVTGAVGSEQKYSHALSAVLLAS